jgi:hypothetical protein
VFLLQTLHIGIKFVLLFGYRLQRVKPSFLFVLKFLLNVIYAVVNIVDYNLGRRVADVLAMSPQ